MLLKLSKYLGINTDHVVSWENVGQETSRPSTRLYLSKTTGRCKEYGEDSHIRLEGMERDAFLAYIEGVDVYSEELHGR